jgi:hypothetical protein
MKAVLIKIFCLKDLIQSLNTSEADCPVVAASGVSVLLVLQDTTQSEAVHRNLCDV